MSKNEPEEYVEDYAKSYSPTRETYWRCQDGRELKVYDMDIGHLKNSAYKVARDNWRPLWLNVLVQELRDRKEYTIADEIMSVHKMNEALK